MKSYFVCQIVDQLSETMPTIFLAPNLVYAHKYFLKFVDGIKGADSSDFVLVVYNGSEVFSSYSEFVSEYDSYLNDSESVSHCIFVSYDAANDADGHYERNKNEFDDLQEVSDEG